MNYILWVLLSKPENAEASLAPIQIKTTPVPLSRLCNEKLGREFFCLNFSISQFCIWLGSDDEGFRGLKGWKLRGEAKLVCQRQKIMPERANVALISQLCKLDRDEDTNPGEKQILCSAFF